MEEITVQKTTSIHATTSKERSVWSALEILYFEEKLPWHAITLEVIREKRRDIDGVSGDNNGLGKMRERFRIKHEIDPDNDPNGVNKIHTPQTDPLFAITQRIRSEIKQSLDAEIEEERTQLVERIQRQESELNELRDAHKSLKENYVAANNEKQLLKDALELAREERLIFLTKAEVADKSLSDYKNEFEQWMRVQLDTQNEAVVKLNQTHVDAIKELNQSHQRTVDKLKVEYESARDGFETARQDSLQELDNLRIENAKLKTKQSTTESLVSALNAKLDDASVQQAESLESLEQTLQQNQEILKGQGKNILETILKDAVTLSDMTIEIKNSVIGAIKDSTVELQQSMRSLQEVTLKNNKDKA